MTKLAAYLIQFVAMLMIIGGGVAIADDLVCGAHCAAGRLALISGIFFLVGGIDRLKC